MEIIGGIGGNNAFAELGQLGYFPAGYNPGNKWTRADGAPRAIAAFPTLAPMMQALVVPAMALVRKNAAQYPVGNLNFSNCFTKLKLAGQPDRFLQISTQNNGSIRYHVSADGNVYNIQYTNYASYPGFVGYGNDGAKAIFAPNNTSKQLVKTTDGLNYAYVAATIQASSGDALSRGLFQFKYLNGLWRALSHSALHYDSVDGETGWTVRNTHVSIQDMTYSPALNRLVGVGAGAYITYSDDNGVTWTRVFASSYVTESLSQVVWDSTNARFVAVGANGRLLTSVDGINWPNRMIVSAGISSVRDFRYVAALNVFLMAALSRDTDGRAVVMTISADFQTVRHFLCDNEESLNFANWIEYADGKVLVAYGNNNTSSPNAMTQTNGTFAAAPDLTYNPATHFIVPRVNPPSWAPQYEAWIRAVV